MSTTTILRQNETPKRISKRQLTDRLVALIFDGKTDMTENAKTLGIGRATAYRYWNAWTKTEEAQQIDVEWWATFKKLKIKSPIKAFEGLTRLKIRKMPQKIEAKEEISERIEHVVLEVTEDEDSILNRAASILNKRLRSTEKPSSIH